MMSATTIKRYTKSPNVKRFREMLGIKHDALTADLGDDCNQQKSFAVGAKGNYSSFSVIYF